MKIIAVRSVPLGEETRNAWASSGVRFIRRSRNVDYLGHLVEKYNYSAVLNLGAFNIPDSLGVPVWNHPDTVKAVYDTGRLRKTINGLGMPERTISGPHWHKAGGGSFGGVGVDFHPDSSLCKWWPNEEGEVQKHIEGTEYRVITVGHKIVQAAAKVDVEWVNGKHNFKYSWTGVNGIKNTGMIPLLKETLTLIPYSERAVLGWDIMLAEKPYVLECNTSPGVNDATAGRIVDAIWETFPPDDEGMPDENI